jgi:hypothetical protein
VLKESAELMPSAAAPAEAASPGSAWLDALREAPALRGIPQVDMGEKFRERGLRLHELTLDPIGHLNAAGHREAAAVLVSVLTQGGPQ